MNPICRCFCQVVQTGFYLAIPVLSYRDSIILASTEQIPRVLQEQGKRLFF